MLCGARAPPAEALRDLQQACTNLQLGREALARRAPFTRPALARLASSVALAGGQHLWARLPGGGAARDAGARKRAPSPGAGAREQKRVRCADGAETRPVSTGGWDETCPVSTGGRDETCPVSTGGRGLGGALAAAPGGWAVRFEGAGGAGLLRLARETHRNYGTCLNRSHEARTGDDVAARRRRALVGELAGGRAGALVEMCRAAAGAAEAEAEAEAEAALALCIEVLARIGADEAGGGGVAGAVGGAEPHADPLEVWAECLLVLGARRAAAGAEVLAGEAARMARHAGDAAGRAGDLGGGALGGDGGALLRAAAALARVPCGAGEGRAWWVAVEEAARGAGRASPGAVCRVLGALLREAAEGDSDGWAAAGARAVSRARGSSLGDGLRAAHGAAPGAMALWWFRRLRAGGAASAAGAGALLAALQLLPPGDARAVVGALRARSLAVPTPPPPYCCPYPCPYCTLTPSLALGSRPRLRPARPLHFARSSRPRRRPPARLLARRARAMLARRAQTTTWWRRWCSATRSRCYRLRPRAAAAAAAAGPCRGQSPSPRCALRWRAAWAPAGRGLASAPCVRCSRASSGARARAPRRSARCAAARCGCGPRICTRSPPRTRAPSRRRWALARAARRSWP